MYLELDCGFYIEIKKPRNWIILQIFKPQFYHSFTIFGTISSHNFPLKAQAVCDRLVTKSALPFIFRLNI